MKQIYSLCFSLLFATSAAAQVVPSGYYRVQNTDSERYIIVTDNQGSVSLGSSSVDLSALLTVRPFSRVVSDPASVIYFEEANDENQYVLYSQGTDTKSISGGYLLTLTKRSDGTFMAGATSNGMTKYLTDGASNADEAMLKDNGSRNKWYIKPITQADDNYFGLQPSIAVGGRYYQTFYAAFPFSFTSSDQKAYVVESVDADYGIAVIAEVSGAVPAATPIIVSASSSAAAQNKLTLGSTGGTVPANNLLTGVYFNNSTKKNQVAYDAATMRVIGLTSDGSIGFVKSNETTIARNTAYLNVPAGCPDELKLMTRSEYDTFKANIKITVTVKSATRAYGDANPTFEYIVEGGKLSGTPQLSCEATATSPVGNYTITVSKGSVTSANVTYVNGTLTVEKAPLKVYGGDYTKKQGEQLPALKAVYTGFKNGETEAVLTKQPVLTCDCGQWSRPEDAKWWVNVSGAEAKNYELTYEHGWLQVVEGDPITLRAVNKSRAYGDANPALTYAFEGGPGVPPGTPVISTVATVSSVVGNYPIKVEQGGCVYTNLVFVDGTLTVEQAPLKVYGGDYTKKQGEQLPAFKAVYTGFKNGETEAVLTKQPVLTCDCGQWSRPEDAKWWVNVSGAEAQNYEMTYEHGWLKVVEGDAITLRAVNKSRAYGDANPELTYEFEGGPGVPPGTPVVSTEATVASVVGNYPIKVEQGGCVYTNLVFVDGTLTVEQAPLTVYGGDYTKKQGEQLPAFKAVYTGFKNGETEAVLTKQPVLSSDCGQWSRPEDAKWWVNVSGAEAQNYAMNYQHGWLQVVEGDPITLRAVNKSREYGDANPELTYEFEGGPGVPPGTPAVSTEATVESPAGDYPIKVEQGGCVYTNLVFVDGTLTVEKAPLLIKAGEYTIHQGEELPQFQATYEGFKLGETEAVLTKQPVFTVDMPEDQPEGDYSIELSGAEAANYDISYQSGVLHILLSEGIGELILYRPADVYTLSGQKVRSRATTLEGLARGVYIIGGRKQIVR